ncbi:unnamed protein product [Caenorhabditis angaria]|uniref:Acyl_transf_3 domain-containing protein n=1 Tax=Caenorhabditis angaria TaxID=860376 RepID=A0A9P1N7X5_9PELO|nr:unnamed protein product [Caenorhabditis angaria]
MGFLSSVSSMSKRQDLQGVRGLAILSVLGFHFYPDIFPNGYLGVDQFFVLSGFLMCMLLVRSKNSTNFDILTTFYSRRFKRILPLYFLIICFALIFLYIIFPDSAISINQDAASKAIIFMSNQPKTVDEEYFKMLELAINIFAHTWSLSVEIQFYFIIPILFIIFKNYSIKTQLFYYSIIGIASFLFNVQSPPEIAFNNVFARIWQFLLGFSIYFLDSSPTDLPLNDYTPHHNPDMSQYPKYVSLITMTYINFTSIFLPAFFVRPMVTILTSIVILYSRDDAFLSNKVLVYIGDISFCLYLIHWPVYAYWKLTMSHNQIALVLLLIASVIVSTIVFETFEKWYLKLTNAQITILISSFFICSILLINKDSIIIQEELQASNHTTYFKVLENMTVDDAIKYNKKWSDQDSKTLFHSNCKYSFNTQFKWCNFTDYEKKGKSNILIFGNSWAANHAKLIFEECSHKAKNMVLGATFGCEVLFPTRNLTACYQNLEQMDQHVKDANADYAFMISRYLSSDGNFTNTDLKKDKIFIRMKLQLAKYMKNIKKKIFFIDAIPPIDSKVIPKIGPMLNNGTSIPDVNKLLVKMDSYERVRKRNEKLLEFCGKKCERVDYFSHFYNNETKQFHYFDNLGFIYLTTVNHFSPYGLEYLRDIYSNICHKL